MFKSQVLKFVLTIVLLVILLAAYSIPAYAQTPVPDITGVSPNKVAPGQVLLATISGTDLDQVTGVDFGEDIAIEINTINSTWIRAKVSVWSGASPGTIDISVTTLSSGTLTFHDMFTVTDAAPVITAITPDHLKAGETGNIVLTGDNFTGVDTASFGADITVNTLTVDSDSQITVNLTVDSAATLGSRDVWVSSAAGTGTWLNGFTVITPKPVIYTVTPYQGALGATLTGVTISGINFTGATSIDFGSGITVSNTDIASTQITADIAISAGADPGYRDVSVTTPEGTGTLTNGFYVLPVPTIAAVDPSDHDRGGVAFQVTIYGSGFVGDIPEVSFGSGITVDPDSIDFGVDYIHLRITIDPSTAIGFRDVTVTLPGGNATLVDGFRVSAPRPTITGISPDHGAPGDAFEVTITGTNLSEVYNISFGNESGIMITDEILVDSATQIRAPIGIAAEAALGSRDVTVTSPGGTDTLYGGFTVSIPPPTISTVSPNQGSQGQTIGNLTITGTYLNGDPSVSFGNGIAVSNIVVIASTQITVDISVSLSAELGTRDVTVTTPGGTYTLSGGFTVLRAPPDITGVSPDKVAPGQAFFATISGTDLDQVTGVDFGEDIANEIWGISPTWILTKVTVSSEASLGARAISVTTSESGNITFPAIFTVTDAAPVITAITPDSLNIGETANITLTGTNFTGVDTASFGADITVNTLTVDSDSQITVNLTVDSAATLGTRDVWVSSAAGTGTWLNGFTVTTTKPVIYTVNPYQGALGATLTGVTISGINFTGTTSIDFGSGITVSNVSVASTQITADIAISAGADPGYRDVSVTTLEGTATLFNGFNVLPVPTITSVDPSSHAPGGDAFDVIIYGTGFVGEIPEVSFGTDSGITVGTEFIDFGETCIYLQITIDPSAAIGYRDVTVTLPGGNATLADGFRVSAPWVWVSGANPNQGARGQTISIVISGEIFVDVSSVSFHPSYGITVNSFTTDSPTQITASITISESAPLGGALGIITTPDGWDDFSFYVLEAPPTITGIAPDHGAPGDAFEVTIYGTNLGDGANISFGTGSGITIPEEIQVDSPTQIRAMIGISAEAALGTRDVTVTTPSGSDTLSGGFTVSLPPTISTVSPSQGAQGQTISVSISGNAFTGATAVTFGTEITVNSFTVDSATSITANITIGPLAALGARDVSVTTSYGTGTLANGFTVSLPLPTISTVSPSQGAQGQTISVLISGNAFTGATAVTFGTGITVNSFAVDSATSITANITIAPLAALGARDVSVTTSYGTGTLANGFTTIKATVTVTKVNPLQGAPGQSLKVTITGTNFTGATAVSFGAGITVNSFTVKNATQITSNISISGAAAPGSRNVSVSTAGGTGTLINGFTVLQPAPIVSSVSPNQGTRGQTLTVTITGANFTGATAVSFGAGITVSGFTVDSSTQIRANITISATAKTGSRTVSVTTPRGTGSLRSGFAVNR